MKFTINEKKKKDGIILICEGDFTIYSVNEFKEKALEVIPDNNKIEIDFSKLEKIDTAAFQLYLAFKQKALSEKKQFSINKINDDISRFFSLLGEPIEQKGA